MGPRFRGRDIGWVIPARSNPDLFEIGVAGEGVEALLGERIPCAAERADDGVVVVEQAVAQMLLAQEQPDALHRLRGTAPKAGANGAAAKRA